MTWQPMAFASSRELPDSQYWPRRQFETKIGIMLFRNTIPCCLTLLAITLITRPGLASEADDLFKTGIQPQLVKSCFKCHGKNDKPAGDINLLKIKTAADLLAKPELLEQLIDALDSGDMPPEKAPPLSAAARKQLVEQLRKTLRISIRSRQTFPQTPIRRMNRFQYNNAVQDLFKLKVEVFSLPERMMREHGNYFQPQTGKMPKTIKVGSRPLGKSQLIEPRLGGVTSFPQDLRAEHGFDNRGDHLTLSPLLLEAFMNLGQSIVQSPDFNARTCGIWRAFFAPPPQKGAAEVETTIRQRLNQFLTRAFRRPPGDVTVDRYTRFVLNRIESGESFAESMQAAAAAAIASPRFFYLVDRFQGNKQKPQADDFGLASRLSFFLWGSIPDQALLDLAAQGKLREPEILDQQVGRMLRDRRLKRFCDSFPSQWLQLERIISSQPDPDHFSQFYFLKYNASMHMMLEPLLLFETVLIENHSILKFIDSDFSYRSNLLQSWYRDGSQGKPGGPVTIDFTRVPVMDRRQGGLITNAAVMTMTSNATHSKPITRGAWIATAILNDPPEPPPANVPALAEKPPEEEKDLTIRERFVSHRQRADCAGCHKRIDPLGFALENYDAAGIWRNSYKNGRPIDASGLLFGRHSFKNVVEFKDALLAEKDRFTLGFSKHLLAFALGREVSVSDSLALDQIVQETAADNYRFQTMIKQIVLSQPFRQTAGQSKTSSQPGKTRK